MICKDCTVYKPASHAVCAKRNKDKPTADCDCLHRLDPTKVVQDAAVAKG